MLQYVYFRLTELTVQYVYITHYTYSMFTMITIAVGNYPKFPSIPIKVICKGLNVKRRFVKRIRTMAATSGIVVFGVHLRLIIER